MGHWLVDDNGKMPSKKEILDNITLETIDTGIGKDDYVTVWYGDKSPKWMLGGHVIDFDYRIGDENKKDKYVDYRFEG